MTATNRRKRVTNPPLSIEALKLGAEEIFFTEHELAARWKRSPKTLRNWRSAGIGPGYHKLGSHVRYSLSAIIQYENQANRLP